MLLNKLGYDLPGNDFHVVPRDLAIRKWGFGSVTAEFTLWERIAASAGTRAHQEIQVELSIPLGACLDAERDGKHIPAHQLGFL